MENVELWVNIVISILTGVATCIPLVIKLVQVIKESVKSKNWTALMQLVLKLMAEAEENYSDYMVKDTQGAIEIALSTCTDDSKARLIILAKANV